LNVFKDRSLLSCVIIFGFHSEICVGMKTKVIWIQWNCMKMCKGNCKKMVKVLFTNLSRSDSFISDFTIESLSTQYSLDPPQHYFDFLFSIRLLQTFFFHRKTQYLPKSEQEWPFCLLEVPLFIILQHPSSSSISAGTLTTLIKIWPIFITYDIPLPLNITKILSILVLLSFTTKYGQNITSIFIIMIFIFLFSTLNH
jgi:hypothetical protein